MHHAAARLCMKSKCNESSSDHGRASSKMP